MIISPSLIQAHGATATAAFTVADAAVIFVIAVVVLGVIVAIAGRRTHRLASRPRLRTRHSRRIQRAAEEDVEVIERDARRFGPDIPRTRDDDL
jgi:hypothetical protein